MTDVWIVPIVLYIVGFITAGSFALVWNAGSFQYVAAAAVLWPVWLLRAIIRGAVEHWRE